LSIKLDYSGSKTVIDKLTSQGFSFELEYADSAPVMPPDVTELDDQGLMNLFQHYNGYLQFIMAQLMCAQIEESTNNKRLDLAEALAMEEYAGTKLTVAAIKAKISMDPNVKSLSDKCSAAYHYRKGMELLYNGAKMDYDFISRELTRRTSKPFSRSEKYLV